MTFYRRRWLSESGQRAGGPLVPRPVHHSREHECCFSGRCASFDQREQSGGHYPELLDRLGLVHSVGFVDRLGFINRLGFFDSLGIEHLERTDCRFDCLGIVDGMGFGDFDRVGFVHRLGLFNGMGLRRATWSFFNSLGILDSLGLFHGLGQFDRLGFVNGLGQRTGR